MSTKTRRKKETTRNLVKKTVGFKIFFGAIFCILVIHSALLIYPFIWLILNSLKTSYEYISTSSLLLPQDWLFKNYIDVFTVFNVKGVGFIEMTWNSIWWSVGNTVIGVFMGGVVAYTVARYDFKAKNIVWGIIMATMMIPLYGSGAAGYKQLFTLGLYDNPLILIKSAGGYGGFQFLMLHSFFKSLPKDYAEAAELDGAGQFYIFLNIMFPMALGPTLALSVSSFVSCWNSYMVGIVSMPSYPLLSTGLYLYEQAMKMGMNYPLYFCGAVICTLPVIVLFCCFQDVFLQNMSMGGLKG